MLPSLPALRAFDAAARLGSFRAAAGHLSVTPTAISHHIRSLEDQLGLALFDRIGRRVVLTEDGRSLAAATSQAFSLLTDTIETLRRPAGRAVRIAAGPIFAARWLMPRISEFWQKFPGIGLEVVPAQHPLKDTRPDVDIAIRWDRIADAPAHAVKLLDLQPVAVASPRFVQRFGPFRAPADLLRVPLLHQRDRRGWQDWFRAMGVAPTEPLRGAVFEDGNVVLRGAVEGQGAILGWLPLMDQDLRDDRIRRLFDEAITPTHAYFLVTGDSRRTARIARTVADWLIEVAQRPGPPGF